MSKVPGLGAKPAYSLAECTCVRNVDCLSSSFVSFSMLPRALLSSCHHHVTRNQWQPRSTVLLARIEIQTPPFRPSPPSAPRCAHLPSALSLPVLLPPSSSYLPSPLHPPVSIGMSSANEQSTSTNPGKRTVSIALLVADTPPEDVVAAKGE